MLLHLNNLSEKIAASRIQIQSSIDRVLKSGWLVLGPEVLQFERAFAQYLKTSDCVSCANGTDAIELALRGLGVGKGDLVATVANAGMYTTIAMLAIGAKPYYMDVDLDTRGATLDEVTRAVQAGVKAVVVTHLYGLAIPEIALIAGLCAKQGIPLLEDCAQAHGACINGQYVGTFGDAGTFSFYPTKNLGALGDGGAIVTRSPVLADTLRKLRQYGWSEKYCVEVAGARNSRLDEMQAAILSGLLPFLDESNRRRRQIASRYSTLIHHPCVKLPKLRDADYVAHLYVITSPQRDLLREYLRMHSIASEVHYPIPDYRQPILSDSYKGRMLENTETLSNEILTLPCYPEMTNEAIDRVISVVNSWQP